MSDFINSVLMPHANLVISLVAFVVVLLIYLGWRQRINFWFMDAWYTFPVIGRIARLSKDSTHSSRDGWLNAERTLCADYMKFIRLVKEPVFNSHIEYLKKAQDLGRTPTPAWAMIFLVVLVIAEGLGFSYMLGTWMAREGSANTHTMLMIAIVLVLCGILVWVTHSAGHQFHRTSLLRGCFKRYKDQGGEAFSSKPIALKDDQSRDDRDPDYAQCANRVSARPNDQGGYAWVYIAVVAIVAIAVLSTYMRWQNLQGELTRDTAMQTQQASAGNPFANGGVALPKEVTDPQKEADDKVAQDERDATASEGMAAFIMLAFIFVITQIVGCSAGYKYGFAGKESFSAYKETEGFATYDAYLAYYEPIIRLAESRLQTLQQRIEENSHQKLALSKNFLDYFNGSHSNLRAFATSEAAPARPVLHSETVQPPAARPVADPLEAAMSHLDGLSDKAEKLAFIKTLEPAVRDAVTAQLKARKEEQEKLDAQLEGLL